LLSCLIPLISVCVLSWSEDKISSFSGYSIGGGEYLPRYTNMKNILDRGLAVTSEYPIEISFTKKDLYMNISFKGNEKENELELPLLYYKGYQVLLDGEEIPNYPLEGGLLGVNIGSVPSGQIEVNYKGTMIQKVSRIMSIISAITFGGYLMFLSRRNKSVAR